jgi:phosphoribosyl-ATP pyrophosphohydrolase
MTEPTLTRLAALIRSRRTAKADASYTRQLLDGGTQRCAKKFGEEAVELVIAATAQPNDAVLAEAADVLYHLLVLLESRDVALADVLAKLDARTATSGLAEKAGRTVPASGQTP